MSKENNHSPSLDEVQALSADIQRIADEIKELEVAAREDMTPKIERLQIMEKALRRDFNERSGESGADSQTVAELYTELRREKNDLDHEMGALGQGAPTTISAGVDAVIKAVDTIKDESADNDQK